MPKAENLNKKPNSQYLANIPPEKLKEIGRKGGKKSGESRRRKRAMRDLMADIMVIPLEKGKTKQANQIKNLAEVQGLNVDTETAIALAQVKKALMGDTNAAIFIRDTLGEKPVSQLEVDADVNNTSAKFDEIIGQLGGEGLDE